MQSGREETGGLLAGVLLLSYAGNDAELQCY
jgi:hypothetical protein